MDREKLDGWCERGILGLVLAILIYTPLATGAVRPQDFVVVEWLTVAILAVWFCRFWINPTHRLLWPIVCWPVLLFMLYAVVCYFKADIEFAARQEMIKVLVYGVLFFAVLNNLHRQELTQIVWITLLVLGTAISLYALAQFLTGSDHVWHFIRPENYRQRGSGTFICPNHLAGYLEMLLPLALAYTLTGRMKHVNKVLLGYAALMIFTGITVTISRGGWMATGLTLVVLFFWLMKQRDYRLQGLLIFVGLVSIAAVFLMTARLSKNRAERITVAGHIEDMRFGMWGTAISIWQDNFWLGAGPAHFDYRYRQYRPADKELQARPERVHNDYLNTLADWGLIGGLLVAGAWLIFYAEVFRSWNFVKRAPNDLTSKRSNKTSFVMGGSLGLLAILFHSFVDFNMHIPANAILAVTLMALVGGHFRFATESYWHTVRWPLRIPVNILILAMLVFLAQQSWQRTAECWWLVKAQEQPYFSQEQIAALEKAFAVEPRNFETAYNIGEDYRMQSWQGGENYQDLAKSAMQWYKRSMDLNPFDSLVPIRYGMCLHWIGQHADAEPYFKRAYDLDPHGYYTLAHLGWHYVQIEQWAEAQKYLQLSLSLNTGSNPIALSYLNIVAERLAELPTPK